MKRTKIFFKSIPVFALLLLFSIQPSFTSTVEAVRTPVANDQSLNVTQDIPQTITLTATDADNDPLTFYGSTGIGVVNSAIKSSIITTNSAFT